MPAWRDHRDSPHQAVRAHDCKASIGHDSGHSQRMKAPLLLHHQNRIPTTCWAPSQGLAFPFRVKTKVANPPNVTEAAPSLLPYPPQPSSLSSLLTSGFSGPRKDMPRQGPNPTTTKTRSPAAPKVAEGSVWGPRNDGKINHGTRGIPGRCHVPKFSLVGTH